MRMAIAKLKDTGRVKSVTEAWENFIEDFLKPTRCVALWQEFRDEVKANREIGLILDANE